MLSLPSLRILVYRSSSASEAMLADKRQLWRHILVDERYLLVIVLLLLDRQPLATLFLLQKTAWLFFVNDLFEYLVDLHVRLLILCDNL